jgi:hypothetical protein
MSKYFCVTCNKDLSGSNKYYVIEFKQKINNNTSASELDGIDVCVECWDDNLKNVKLHTSNNIVRCWEIERCSCCSSNLKDYANNSIQMYAVSDYATWKYAFCLRCYYDKIGLYKALIPVLY